jgi:hypothetical protein
MSAFEAEMQVRLGQIQKRRKCKLDGGNFDNITSVPFAFPLRSIDRTDSGQLRCQESEPCRHILGKQRNGQWIQTSECFV